MEDGIVRVFISSPSDVEAERRRTARVMERLNGELDRIRFEPILWEESFYRANETFQPQIPDVSAVDMVVCILWKRLGSDLPPEFNREDGSPRTGTEWEFETAMSAALRQEIPDIFLFRKTETVTYEAETAALEQAQFKALKAFWERWVQNAKGHFSAGFQHFETTDQFETRFEHLLRHWLAERQTDVVWPVDVKGSPFRGLQSYDAAHAPVFFGRRRAVRESLARLKAAARRGCGFLLLLGQSGSGKSSLARAGLLPKLLAGGAVGEVDRWRGCVLRPGDDPLAALCKALYMDDALPELAAGDFGDPAALEAQVVPHPAGIVAPVRGALKRWGQAIALAEGYERTVETRLVLVVDQLEELVTLAGDRRDVFMKALTALAHSGDVWVVATLRGDFYGAMQAVEGLVDLKDAGAVQDVLAPGAAEIREIIEGPAQAAGLSYGEDPDTGQSLSAILEQAASSPDSLPLLNFMLQELFEKRDLASNTLEPEVYDQLGGLAGAIEARAEQVFQGLDGAAQESLPALIRLLVTVNEDDTATARLSTLDRDALQVPLRALVDAFVAARLLVTGGDGERVTLRVAHEALLTHWARARNTIHQGMSDLRLWARLENQARLWREADEVPARLLHGELELSEASDLSRRLQHELDPALKTFIDTSIKMADVRRRKALNRTRQAGAGPIVVMIILTAVGAYYISSRDRAEKYGAEGGIEKTEMGIHVNNSDRCPE